MTSSSASDRAGLLASDGVAEAATAPLARASGTPGVRALLGDSSFRRLWLGQTISELGDGMAGFALVILVHRVAGTASAIATLGILTSLPQLVMGLHAGVFVDRWDRRLVMIASDLLRAALAVGLFVAAGTGALPWMYALAVGQAAGSVFFEPARTAFLPSLVAPQALLAANSLCQTTRVVSMTAGAALAGVLLSAPGGMRLVFGFDALSFAVSAACLWTIRARARASAEAESAPTGGVTADLVSGLRLFLGNPVLRGLLATFAITVLGMGAITVLFVPYMVSDLGASSAAIGLARVAQTAGMMAGGALLATLGTRFAPAAVLAIGIGVLGPCLALMGLAPHWAALLPILLVTGICSSAIQAGSATFLQQAVPDRVRGRAESTLDTLLVLVMMIGMAAVGSSGDRFGARTVFLVAGGLVLAAGIVARVWARPTALRGGTEGPLDRDGLKRPPSRAGSGTREREADPHPATRRRNMEFTSEALHLEVVEVERRGKPGCSGSSSTRPHCTCPVLISQEEPEK